MAEDPKKTAESIAAGIVLALGGDPRRPVEILVWRVRPVAAEITVTKSGQKETGLNVDVTYQTLVAGSYDVKLSFDGLASGAPSDDQLSEKKINLPGSGTERNKQKFTFEQSLIEKLRIAKITTATLSININEVRQQEERAVDCWVTHLLDVDVPPAESDYAVLERESGED